MEVGTISIDVDESDPDFPSEHVLSTANDPQTITVVAGATTPADPVGYAPTGTLRGLAWLDADGDGLQEASESPLAGTLVSLWEDTDGDGVADAFTATTPAATDGTYVFNGLPPGDYEVRFSLPAGSVPTARDSGSDDSLDSDIGSTGRTSLVSLATGEILDGVDAGAYWPVTIGDFAWSDTDGDGAYGSDEQGAANVGVTARWAGPDGVFGTADDATFDATTGADGSYTIAGLPPGTYEVSADIASDGELTFGDDPYMFTAPSGTTITSADFGIAGNASLGGIIWLDADRDGDRDEGEPRLAGVSLDITWAGLDGVLGTDDDVATRVVTGDDGSYALADTPSGRYNVEVVASTLPQDLAATFDPDGLSDSMTTTTLAPGATVTHLDFGYGGTGGVDGRVWIDLDGDGWIDVGEPRLDGVSVRVVWHGPDGLFGTADDAAWTDLTGEDGSYTVIGLPPGQYTVSVDSGTVPDGYAASHDLDGVLDEQTTIAVGGRTRSDVDFGYRGTSALGDQVWVDEDGDSVFDDDEAPLPGIRVQITWAGPDGEFGTDDDHVFEAVTDADGRYYLELVPPGIYRVEVLSGSVPGMEPGVPVTISLSSNSENLDGDIPVHGPTAQPPVPNQQPPLPQTGAHGDRLFAIAWVLIALGAALVATTRLYTRAGLQIAAFRPGYRAQA